MSDEDLFATKYFGKFKGYVRDNVDPEGRGRLRVYCPQVMGEDSDNPNGWLGWAEACFPWMGGLSTLDFGVPYTKQENGGEDVGVWVEFEAGEVDHPIWVGTFIVAPINDKVRSLLPASEIAGTTGGSLLDNPPTGSAVADINPPKPIPKNREVRLLAKPGVDIVIGSSKGGFIIIGPSGVNMEGIFVRANGRVIEASLQEISGLWPLELYVSTPASPRAITSSTSPCPSAGR